MVEQACDVAVIGAGTAGIAAFRAAREAGASAVLIEAGPGGTTCARVGCMPSKLLITAATAAYDARDAGRFGIRVGDIAVDGPAVLARVRAERDRFVAGVRDGLAEEPEDARIAGYARFVDATTLLIDDHTRVRFRAAVIATGSSPNVPEPLVACGADILTTDTLFEIADLPASLAVLGAGAVGLEIAQAMARLGVSVCLFDPGKRVGGLTDAGLNAEAVGLFGAEMSVHLGAKVTAAEHVADGIRLHWTDADGRLGTQVFARVLAAAGRTPNLSGLDLHRAGLRCDDNGMPAFDARSLLCEGAPVLIAGDANADRPVLHEAARQGRIAGRNAVALAATGRDAVSAPPRWTALAMVFTHPQIASVGDPLGGALVGGVDFSDQGRAKIMGRNAGALHVRAERDGRLVGAEMLGPEAEHLAHILAFAIADGHTAQGLLDRPFYHPAVEEGLKTALSQIVSQIDRD